MHLRFDSKAVQREQRDSQVAGDRQWTEKWRKLEKGILGKDFLNL